MDEIGVRGGHWAVIGSGREGGRKRKDPAGCRDANSLLWREFSRVGPRLRTPPATGSARPVTAGLGDPARQSKKLALTEPGPTGFFLAFRHFPTTDFTMSIEIKMRKNEPIDRALRRMKKKLDRENIIKDVRAKRYYEKPCEKRRRKDKVAAFTAMLRARYAN